MQCCLAYAAEQVGLREAVYLEQHFSMIGFIRAVKSSSTLPWASLPENVLIDDIRTTAVFMDDLWVYDVKLGILR